MGVFCGLTVMGRKKQMKRAGDWLQLVTVGRRGWFWKISSYTRRNVCVFFMFYV